MYIHMEVADQRSVRGFLHHPCAIDPCHNSLCWESVAPPVMKWQPQPRMSPRKCPQEQQRPSSFVS